MKILLLHAQQDDFTYFHHTRTAAIADHLKRLNQDSSLDSQLDYHRQVFNTDTLHMIFATDVQHQVKYKRVGFVNLKYFEGFDRIGLFCIEPEFQNKGIGTLVMTELIRRIDLDNHAALLNVLRGSPAHHLYRRFDFLPYGSDKYAIWYMRKRSITVDEGDGAIGYNVYGK